MPEPSKSPSSHEPEPKRTHSRRLTLCEPPTTRPTRPRLLRTRSKSVSPALETQPYDIRLSIYSDALVSPQPIEIGPSGHAKWDNHLLTALVRTNKLIYDETAPVLYGSNTFRIDRADYALLWLERIGPGNVALVKRLDIAPAIYRDGQMEDSNVVPLDWVRLFDRLAVEATGLRHVKLFFDMYPFWGGHSPRMTQTTFGTNIAFLRAVAELKGLRSFELFGTYPKLWQEYLEKKMGVRVSVGRDDEHLKFSREASKLLWPKEEMEMLGEELAALGLGEQDLRGKIDVEVRIAL